MLYQLKSKFLQGRKKLEGKAGQWSGSKSRFLQEGKKLDGKAGQWSRRKAPSTQSSAHSLTFPTHSLHQPHSLPQVPT